MGKIKNNWMGRIKNNWMGRINEPSIQRWLNR